MHRAALPLLAGIFLSPSGPLQAGEPSPSDPVAGRNHWAFQPFQVHPPKTHPVGSRSVIDDFVFERRQAAGLDSAPDAQPKDLIRRVHFLLTGLPPTLSEVEAYVADPRPDAYPRLVDRLLASPRFGERWGRHWLDLARYADSNGLDENFLFREAWRYRNWVIDAVNADMPFDRFILEQIAGDLLPYATVEQRDRQRIGAGFMVMGPKVLLGNDPKRQRMEVADEQIDTLGRALLGLTLGCARCHDHKFEPIPTADYYAMAGILTSTEVMERRHMLNQQRVMERLVGLGPDGDEMDSTYETYWRELPGLKEKAKQAKQVLDLLEKDDAAGFKDVLEKNAAAVAEGAREAARPRAERIRAQQMLVTGLAHRIAHPPSIPPRAMIPSDVKEPGPEAIRVAGAFDQPGETVPRGFLRVVSSGRPPVLPRNQSGRIELAQWLTDVDQGSGRLAARVLANRIWHHLIGCGLVRTVDNFGRTGEVPSHPELLDYLATELVESGWSVKSLARQIVLSRTFALSTDYQERAHDVDPDNRLLWRANRRRLDPEALRDALLAVAERLDLSRTESTVWYLGDQATAVGANKNRRRTDFPCRSVYLPVIRNDLPEVFEAFDFANPHMATGARPRTTSAAQGLFMLNDTLVLDTGEAVAKILLNEMPGASDEVRMKAVFERIILQPPTEAERKALLDFLRQARDRFRDAGDTAPDLQAWSTTGHAILTTSRFQFLD